MALASTMQECMYSEQLLESIDCYKYTQTVVYEDNQETIALAKNPMSRQRYKHVDIKYPFVRSIVNEGKVCLLYCTTEEMVADIMTKPVSKLKLRKFTDIMFGVKKSGRDPHLYCSLLCNLCSDLCNLSTSGGVKGF